MSESLATCPDPPTVTAVRTVLDVLRSDPDLATYNVAIWAPEADRRKLLPNYPTEEELPVVRLVNWAMPARWLNEAEHKGDLVLTFECITAGMHYADEMKLCWLLKSALFPDRDGRRFLDVRALMQFPGGPTRERLQVLSSQAKALGTDHYARVATVQYTLIFDVPT